MAKIYSVLLITEDDERKTLAVNIPKTDYDFIEDYLWRAGGFTRFGVSLYDTEPCHSSDKVYGKYCGRKTCMKWLAENVFFDWKNFDTEYASMKAEWQANRRIKNMAIDILYEDFKTGTHYESVYKKILGELWNLIPENYIEHPVRRERIKKYISEAIVATLIAA